MQSSVIHDSNICNRLWLKKRKGLGNLNRLIKIKQAYCLEIIIHYKIFDILYIYSFKHYDRVGVQIVVNDFPLIKIIFFLLEQI